MELLTDVLNWIAALPEPLLVTVTGILVFVETTIGIGFLAPGESGLFVAATSIRNVADFLVLWAVVTVCAGLGDSIGYLVGRRYGPKLWDTRLIQKYGTQAWDRATGILHRRGAWAVFFGRFLPVVRTLTPAAAGTSKLPLYKFLPAVVAGTITWSAAHLAIGAALGEAARRIEDALSAGGALLVGVATVTLVVLLIRFQRRRGPRSDSAPAENTVAATSELPGESGAYESRPTGR